jgi:hypothetical protein
VIRTEDNSLPVLTEIDAHDEEDLRSRMLSRRRVGIETADTGSLASWPAFLTRRQEPARTVTGVLLSALGEGHSGHAELRVLG